VTATSAEELARIAGVKAETVRRTAKELFELLERDLKIRGVQGDAE
jgi:DNA-directed RNA polymerase specialized sigma24 family protein